ncbi:cation:proton antiporter domain-containing protein [Parafrankia discariae]|uniref:cation:proton antiporter domain-containing protein n=1 Tax=Parafrankia discariae TaxID=365528 RepID=UPI0038994BE4
MLTALRLPLCVAAGYVPARLIGSGGVADSAGYGYATAALLGVGLYGATSAIPRQARRDGRTIVSVVTVGVLLKILLIGGSLSLVFYDPVFFVLAAAVAQIDPLSVASLMRDSPMSRRAKSLLMAWSSFDDPITVVVTLLLLATLPATVVGESSHTGPLMGGGGFTAAATGLFLSTLLAVAAWRIARFARSRPNPVHDRLVIGAVVVAYVLAVARLLMIGLATAGLFLRPRSPRWAAGAEQAVQVALLTAAAMLGVLLASAHVDVPAGVALGVAAFLAQIAVSLLLTRHFNPVDRAYLAISQQNGITSIVLALALEPFVPAVVGVIGVAVATINLLHLACNHAVRRSPRLLGGVVARVGGSEEPEEPEEPEELSKDPASSPPRTRREPADPPSAIPGVAVQRAARPPGSASQAASTSGSGASPARARTASHSARTISGRSR